MEGYSVCNFIIFSKSSYSVICEFNIDFDNLDIDYDIYTLMCEEIVLGKARELCKELGYSFDDVYVYERCYFKD